MAELKGFSGWTSSSLEGVADGGLLMNLGQSRNVAPVM